MKRIPFWGYVISAVPVGFVMHVLLVFGLRAIPSRYLIDAADALIAVLRYGPSTLLLLAGLLLTNGVRSWSIITAVRIGVVVALSAVPLVFTMHPIFWLWCEVLPDCP